MNITLIVVGKTTENYLEIGIAEYVKRMSHYTTFELVIIPALRAAKSMSQEQIRQAEGELILSRLATSDRLVLLDDKGFHPTSEQMAQWLQATINRGTRRLVLVVGGAYGFSPTLYDRAHDQLSLSRLTFSHQMVRLIFLEQLYRSFTILNNEPYHHS